jgi:ubiquinone/menaquinone biosynthesis C-methylase UbiE
MAATVVDLGCGTGIDCRNIRDRLKNIDRIIGIDHDPVALEAAKDGGEDGIEYLLAQAHELPVADATIDAVRCERIIQHLEFPEATMKEVYRVLKPGGRLIIVETDWMSMSFGTSMVAAERQMVDEKLFHDLRNGLASRNMGEQLANIGFQVESLDSYPTMVYQLKDAKYIMGFNKSIEKLERKGKLMDAFIDQLERNDRERRFIFRWDTFLYVAQKPL